jgi:hypothetical protein
MAYIYVGAMLIAGSGSTEEVITVTAVTATTLTATFAFVHASSDQLIGATFPVGEDNNPFFSQNEMLNYLSDGENDYLTRVPVILNRTTQNFAPTQRIQNMPSDAIQVERVAVNGYALMEQGQASLDLLNYTWGVTTPGPPETWFEDRLNFMTYGVQPVPLNTFVANLLYAQRDSALLALNEGFLLPDLYLTYVKYYVLAQCFAKDGEMRDQARAQYCVQRVDTGVKIGLNFYESVMAQGTVNS